MLEPAATLSHNATYLMSEQYTPRIAILGSPDPEGGETAEAVAEALHKNEYGLLNFAIALTIATQPEAGILRKTQRWNDEWGWETTAEHVSLYESARKPADHIIDLVDDHNIDLVVSLGFKTVLEGQFVEEYGYLPDEDSSVYDARAINLHPGTVPLTSGVIGKKASERELAAFQDGEIGVGQIVMHAITEEVDDPRAVFDRRYVPILKRNNSEENGLENFHARKRRIEQAAAPYMIDRFLECQREEGLV